MRPLSNIKTRRDSSAYIALNCFQCIAYVFEYNAEKMTQHCVETRWYLQFEILNNKLNLSKMFNFVAVLVNCLSSPA